MVDASLLLFYSFCLWGAPGTTPNQTIGDVEAAVVAYCSKSGHGARILPAGAITGLQVLKTSAYTQWTGYINQTALNLQEDDSGGELDPHGADEVSFLSFAPACSALTLCSFTASLATPSVRTASLDMFSTSTDTSLLSRWPCLLFWPSHGRQHHRGSSVLMERIYRLRSVLHKDL